MNSVGPYGLSVLHEYADAGIGGVELGDELPPCVHALDLAHAVRRVVEFCEKQLQHLVGTQRRTADPGQGQTRARHPERLGGERCLADADGSGQRGDRVPCRERDLQVRDDQLLSRTEKNPFLPGNAALEKGSLQTEVLLIHVSDSGFA